MFNIVVLIKPVYDSKSIKWNYYANAFDCVAPSWNRADIHALQWANNFKRQHDTIITVISVVENKQQISTHKLHKFNIDEFIIIESEELNEHRNVTASILFSELKNKRCDLILSGSESEDFQSGITPLVLAEMLKLPSLTTVQKIIFNEETGWEFHRKEGRNLIQSFTMELPAIISVVPSISTLKYVPKTVARRFDPQKKQAKEKYNSSRFNVLNTTEPQPTIKYIEPPLPECKAQERAMLLMGLKGNEKDKGDKKTIKDISASNIHYISHTLQKWLKE